MVFESWRVARAREPELMDDPSLPAGEHMAALDALGRINFLSRTASQLAAAIERVVPRAAGGSGRLLRVVDLACGGGDVTVSLARAFARPACRRRLGPVAVTGIDVSERAVERARAHAVAAGVESVDFLVRDVVSEGCPPCDVATNSLFLHHLDDDDCIAVLRGMSAAARLGIVVSDLVRSGAGLALAVVTTSVVCRSRVARVDGPRSVRAARMPAEYRSLCDRAGLAGATLRRVWPERFMIEWRRAPAADGERGTA